MASLGCAVANEVGLRMLLSPFGSNAIIRTACCTVGVALPVYSTFKAIEKKDRNEQEKWLLYWAAYGSFSVAEVFSDKILSWVPFYYHLKFAFLVWLQLPSNDGSRHLYARHLRPFFIRHQVGLDRLLNFISNELTRFCSAHREEILYLRTLLARCTFTASQLVKCIINPRPSGRHNAIEGPGRPASQHNQDSSSDHES